MEYSTSTGRTTDGWKSTAGKKYENKICGEGIGLKVCERQSKKVLMIENPTLNAYDWELIQYADYMDKFRPNYKC